MMDAIPPASPAPAAGPGPVITMSAEVDQLFAAVVELQGNLVSPARNKLVSVQRRDGTTYDHSYSTADLINDMLRGPLREAGLALMHFTCPGKNGALLMVTKLLHRSGQWMDSVMPVLVEDRGPQALGSALTYTRRNQISAMLNIASTEDDDANQAAGNSYVEHADRLSRLVQSANVANDASGVIAMLRLWQAGLTQWMSFRDQPDRADDWEVLLRLISSAMRRVHGEDMAIAWSSATVASVPGDLAVMRARWEGEWRPAREAMRKASEASYGLLMEHMRLQSARVDRMADTLARQAAPAAALAAPLPAEELEGYGLVDEAGDPASDHIGVRLLFAQSFASQHHASEDRHALWRHNHEALEWCEADPEAAAYLREHAAPWPPAWAVGELAWPAEGAEPAQSLAGEPAPVPAPPPVVPAAAPTPEAAAAVIGMPMTPLQTPALGHYLLLAKRALAAMPDGQVLQAWVAANRPTIDSLPQGTRVLLLALIVAAEGKLGGRQDGLAA